MEETKTLENSKALLDASRAAGCTVIHVPIVFDEVRYEIRDTCSYDDCLYIYNL